MSDQPTGYGWAVTRKTPVYITRIVSWMVGGHVDRTKAACRSTSGSAAAGWPESLSRPLIQLGVAIGRPADPQGCTVPSMMDRWRNGSWRLAGPVPAHGQPAGRLGPLQQPGPCLHRLDHGSGIQVLDIAVGGCHGRMAQLALNDVQRRALGR